MTLSNQDMAGLAAFLCDIIMTEYDTTIFQCDHRMSGFVTLKSGYGILMSGYYIVM